MDSDDVLRHIKMAQAIVEESELEGESLRLAAFSFALDHLDTLESNDEQTRTTATTYPTPNKTTSDTGYEKISRALDVPLETVELLYDLAEAGIALNLPPKKLPRGASAAMREIAIILTVGMKYAGIAEATSFDVVRAACEDHGKLDKKNFSAILGSMRPALIVTGKGTEKALIAKKPADTLAREILVRYSQII